MFVDRKKKKKKKGLMDVETYVRLELDELQATAVDVDNLLLLGLVIRLVGVGSCHDSGRMCFLNIQDASQYSVQRDALEFVSEI